MEETNTRIIIAQNELTNIAIEIMQKHQLGERDMVLVMQGVDRQILNMAFIRLAYYDAERNEMLRQAVKEQNEKNNSTESAE